MRRLEGDRRRAVARGAFLLWIAVGVPAPAQAPAAPPGPDSERLHRGVLLIAGRDLRDPNFSRTVILVTHLGDSGTVGLVLNRPLPVPAMQALPPLAGVVPDAGSLFLGGPVAAGTLQLLIRTDADLGAASRVVAGVHLVEHAPVLDDLAEGRIRATALRLYAGYAGWGAGQLESELLRGDWLLWPADAQTVFAEEPETLWPVLVDRASARWVRARPPGADVAARAQYNPKLADGTELWHRPAGGVTTHSCRIRPDIRFDDYRVADACGRGRLLTC